MSTNDEKVIELSRVKIVWLVVGAVVLAAIGLWIATLDDATLWSRASRFGLSPAAIRYIGVAGIVFFSACGLFGICKFFDKKPGLVLAANGFVDNASAVAAGFVPWSEVTDVQTFQVARQEMLIVMVGDSERYIRRGNVMKQAINRANFKLCGSPIAISANALKIGFHELTAAFKLYWSKYGNAHQDVQACGLDNPRNERPA